MIQTGHILIEISVNTSLFELSHYMLQCSYYR